MNLLPLDFNDDSIILAYLHFPIFLWVLLGLAYTGDDYLQSSTRLAYIKFNLELNRPQVRNALDLQMREELRDFFTEVQNNDGVKVIVLTGEGNTFSAGGDLSAF